MARIITPWSVKGIDDQTRNVARRKAKDAGINIGTWIDKAILEYNYQQNSSADDKVEKINIFSDLTSHKESLTINKLSERLLEHENNLNQELRPLMFSLNDLALRLVAAETLQNKVSKGLVQNTRFADGLIPFIEKSSAKEVNAFLENSDELDEERNDKNLEKLNSMASDDDLTMENYDAKPQSSKVKFEELVEEVTDHNFERLAPIAAVKDFDDEINVDLIDTEVFPSDEKKPLKTRGLFTFVVIILIFVFGGAGTYLFPVDQRKIMKAVNTTSALHLDSVSRTLLDGADYLEKILISRLLKAFGLVNDPDFSEKNINSDYRGLDSNAEKNALALKSQHANVVTLSADNRNSTYSYNKEDKIIRVLEPPKNDLSNSEKSKKLSQIRKKPIHTLITAKLLKDRANSGEAYAQYKLGMQFTKNGTSKVDYYQAAHWLKIAAVQGLTEAQYNLGVLYERGLGVLKDESQALLWFHSAAKKQHSMAQYNLGNFFLLGKGTQKNYLEAVRWFKLASNNGVAEAAQNFLILSKVSGVADLNHLERSKLHLTTFPVQLIGLSTSTKLQKYDKRTSIMNRIVSKEKEGIVRAPLSVNEMISEIQFKLSKDGFYIGSIDGLFGPNVESAIRVYQLEQGLPVSGSPSKELLQYMQRD